MKLRRLIAGMAASGIVAASVLVPISIQTAQGDVNGDSQTNILDMQIIAYALLKGSLSVHAADMNRDGRIDVLDFQLLVTKTSRPVSEKSKHHSTLLEAYVGIAPSRSHVEQSIMKKIDAVLVESEEALGHARYEAIFSPQLPSGEPAVRGPSPHSPPLAA